MWMNETFQGVVPPHLFKHLARSGDPHRAQRARAALLTDTGHRVGRQLLTEHGPQDGPETAGEGLNREVHTADHTQDLPGTLVRTEDQPACTDDSVNRAYEYLGDTYRLFREVYDRNSLDGHGLPLVGSVHFGHEYNNAFWNGQQMAFGDGDGDIFRDFTTDLTVIAHELTHGVVESTANLAYTGQAGALNEHIADVFGVLALQYKNEVAAREASWLIGADLFTDEVEGAALRSLKAPGTAYDDDVLGVDPQPAHMDRYVSTFEDNGGVHINSGIPNHAFYLAAVAIGGAAWERAGRIWYETLTGGKVERDADFAAFAGVTKDTAVRLYGDGSAEAIAVGEAWDGVGVRPAA